MEPDDTDPYIPVHVETVRFDRAASPLENLAIIGMTMADADAVVITDHDVMAEIMVTVERLMRAADRLASQHDALIDATVQRWGVDLAAVTDPGDLTGEA